MSDNTPTLTIIGAVRQAPKDRRQVEKVFEPVRVMILKFRAALEVEHE